MHPAHIQAELKIAGYTQKALAQELEVSEFHISEVVHKKRPSDRVMTRISEIIQRNPHEVFPEYYFRKNARKQNTAG
ncbi:MAG: helix-turn-helix domain-containing protein [Desulfobacteraceae bacterium]|jgi:lambda repressor-like predicted transcriptional regulator